MKNETPQNPRIEDDDMANQTLRNALGSEAPQEVHTRMNPRFEAFRTQLEERENPQTSRRDRFRPFSFPFAWAGAGAACTLVAVLLVLAFTGPSSLSWADVVARFKSVRYFSATVYITENPLESPDKIEVWVGKDQRSRLHHQGRVFFAEGKKVRRVYDVKSRQEIPVATMNRQQLRENHLNAATNMIEMLGGMEEYSLDAVLATFSGKKTISPPLENAEASIAEDMQVFDVTGDQSPGWARIWVLKSSGLPVRMRVWRPRNGNSVEALWDYMAEQPAEAFDPDAFAKALRDNQGQANNLYALLKDPGGREMTPQDLFKQSGLHMPKIEEVGRTEEGAVWVKSSNSVNHLPDGNSFYGFGKLTDNLGQEYLHTMQGHRVDGDLCLEHYVPLYYGLGFKKPDSYTLTCWSQPAIFEQSSEIVGAMEVKEWRDNAPIPALFDGKGPGKNDVLKRAVREWRERENWDNFDKLLALIPGEPESDAFALWREEEHLEKMVAMERDNVETSENVFALTSRLYPLVKETAKKHYEAGWSVVRSHIAQLLKRGRRPEAEEILRDYIQKDALGKEEGNGLALYYTTDLLMREPFRDMKDDEINALFGFDVLSDPAVAEKLRYWRDQASKRWEPEKDPQYDAWRDYAKRISTLYDGRPVPERIEFLFDAEPFDEKAPCYCAPLPGKEGYRINSLRAGWEQFGDLREGVWEPFEVADSLKAQKLHFTYVFKGEVSSRDMMEPLMKKMGVEAVDKTVRRKVWVAKYDGRKLPYWRTVRSLDASHLGTKPVARAGGTRTTAASVLECFEEAVNRGREGVIDPIKIVDETGLPNRPGKNQTWASICLTYSYSFWEGAEATELAKRWFEENFGITFHEEERDMAVQELRPVSSTNAVPASTGKL